MVKGSMKYKVEYIGGGAAYFGKRQLLSMIQQPAEPQLQQPAESVVKVSNTAMRSARQQQDPPTPYEEPSRAAAHVDSAVAVAVAGGSAGCVAEGESRLN